MFDEWLNKIRYSVIGVQFPACDRSRMPTLGKSATLNLSLGSDIDPRLAIVSIESLVPGD